MTSKIAAAAVVLLLLGLFALSFRPRGSEAALASQNGWTVVDQAATASYQVPGSKVKLRLRTGDAATVLLDVATWFDRNVEDIDVGQDDWGWSVRKIEGSTSYSNHASGTAIDLNAQRHPMGVAASANLSAAQINAIRTRLQQRYKGVVRWGGDYRSRPDPMHFEINKDAAAVKSLADVIRWEALAALAPKTTAPAAPPAPAAPVVPPTTARIAPPTTVDAATHPESQPAGAGEEAHEAAGPVEQPAAVAAPLPAPTAAPVKAVPAFTG